ncbi:hypothetical protein VTG60DRAFT_1449 [Thermothelomyces hinnuleus]
MSDAQQSSPPPGTPPPAPQDLPHDSLQLNIIVSSTICWFIAALFVALRFYTRGIIIRVLGWSDWSILLALILSGVTCGSVIEQAIHGAGYHIWDLDPNDTASAIAWGRAAWYGMLFYALTLAFSKMAILLLYIHLFAFKWARKAGQVLLGVVVISHLYMTIVTFTACIPLRSYWDFTITKKYCHPQSMWWSSTGLHMVTDFLIFLLPMPVVWTIRLPRRQKFALSGVFGFGFIVCFISILRLLQLIRAQTDPDFTWVAAELSYLTAVEVNGAIVCACVMTLKPLLARVFPRIWGSTGWSGSGGSGGSSNRRRRSGGWGFGRRRRNGNGSGKVRKLKYGGSGTFGSGGPPTIGSLPSKLRMGPLGTMERDVWIESGGGGGGGGGDIGSGAGVGVVGGGRRVWVDGGYVEIEDGDGDTWGVDVELVEHPNGRGADGGALTRDAAAQANGKGFRQPQRPPPVGSGKVRVDTEVRVQLGPVLREARLLFLLPYSDPAEGERYRDRIHSMASIYWDMLRDTSYDDEEDWRSPVPSLVVAMKEMDRFSAFRTSWLPIPNEEYISHE